MSRLFTLATLLSLSVACAPKTREQQKQSKSRGYAVISEEEYPTAEEAPPGHKEERTEFTHTINEPDLSQALGDLPPAVQQGPHPLASKSDAEIKKMLSDSPEEIGSASLGKTNSGALFGGIPMPKGEQWKIVNSRETYGTTETVNFLSHVIGRVNALFPDTPPINIGDISRPNGGHFNPHVSHQSGRDVDLGFYYKDNSRWYARADRSNLDLPRTWALIKFLVTETDVEAIFVDRSIQKILREYAEELREDSQWLDQVFGGESSNLRPLLLHEDGHQTHLHIRFYNPIAQETGRRVYRPLVKLGKIKPPTYFIKYKVKRGDSLIKIARKYKVEVKAIKKANRLKNNRIYAKRTYKIPKRGGVVQPPKLVLPARRIPKAQAGQSRTSK